MPLKGPSQNPALKLIRDAARAAAPNLGSAPAGRPDSVAEKLSQANSDIARLQRFLAKTQS